MLPYILAAVGGYLIGDSLKGKQYADGGMMANGGRIKVGTFSEEQLKNKEDKKAVEKAQKESGLTYVDTKIIKKGGKMYLDVYLIPNEEYYNSSKFAKGGGVKSYSELRKVPKKVAGELTLSPSRKAQLTANKLMLIDDNIWEELDINSGSQLYNDDELQKKYVEKLEKANVDKIISSENLIRSKVMDLLEENNYSSLHQYFIYKGIFGEAKRNDYINRYISGGSYMFLNPALFTKDLHGKPFPNPKMAKGGVAKGQKSNLKDVYSDLRSRIDGFSINKESETEIQADVRDWGNWEHDYLLMDKYNYNSMILSDSSYKKMNEIVKEVKDKYPDVEIHWATSDKDAWSNYIDFTISHKKKMSKGGGVEFKPYGKTKGIFKLEYKVDGEHQSEIWESKEMVEDSAKRYSKIGYTDIKITELKKMAKGGGVKSYISRKGTYTGRIVSTQSGERMIGKISGYRGNGEPVYDVHNFGSLRKDMGEKVGELSNSKIKDLLKNKMAKGGQVYKLGDKWSPNFDYTGMLETALKAQVSWGMDKLRKLYDSFEDVNYHTANRSLWEALKSLKDNDVKAAEKHLENFRADVMEELK